VPKLHDKDLEQSINPEIQQLVVKSFVDKKSARDAEINDLRKDMPRSLKLNHVEYVRDGNIWIDEEKYLIPVGDNFSRVEQIKNFTHEGTPNYFTDTELKIFLDYQFRGKFGEKDYSSLIVEYYSQGLLGYALTPLTLASLTASKGRLLISEIRPNVADDISTKATKSNNLYISPLDNFVYLESTINAFEVVDVEIPSRRCTIQGTTWVFKLTENGFRFVEAKIHDKRAEDMYIHMKAPATLEEYPEYSLRSRIRDAFHEIYNPNSNNYDRDAAAFFGYKEVGNSYLQNYETLELLAIPLTLVKNTLKLFTEFFPRVVEKAMDKVVLHSRESISNKNLLRLANFIPTVIYGMAWGFRQIASRLTSPIATMKSAYEKGAEIHPVVGVVAAGLSAALSLAIMTATGAAGVAALSAVGAGAMVTAATWITANTAVIGSFFTLAAAQTAAVFGMTLSATAASVVAASTITSTIIVGVMALREGFKKALGSLFTRNERKTLERQVAARAESQAAEEAVKVPETDLTNTGSAPSSTASIAETLRAQLNATAINEKEELEPEEEDFSDEEKHQLAPLPLQMPLARHSTPVPSKSSTHGGPTPPPASPISTTATTATPLSNSPRSASPKLFKPELAEVPQPPKRFDERKRRKSCVF
jgi:hypothetical protein